MFKKKCRGKENEGARYLELVRVFGVEKANSTFFIKLPVKKIGSSSKNSHRKTTIVACNFSSVVGIQRE